jgi:OPA family sugar phosphate sensor protein UhpC-like MFS transporter
MQAFIGHVSFLDILCMPFLFVPLQVVIGYTVGVAAMLLAFWSVPATLPWLQWATVFMIGFFLYGPQMLIGLCGAELVGPESVGASEGFLGWIAYLGEPT